MIEDRRTVLKLNEYMAKNKSMAIINIVSTDGSTPRGVGSSNRVRSCFKSRIFKRRTRKSSYSYRHRYRGETPEEIAVSIMAEIQAIKYGKDVPHLFKGISRFD